MFYKFQFVEQLISKGLTENKPSALKICIAVSKEKGFFETKRKSRGNNSPKVRNQGKHVVNPKLSFLSKIYRKTAENKSK